MNSVGIAVNLGIRDHPVHDRDVAVVGGVPTLVAFAFSSTSFVLYVFPFFKHPFPSAL